MQTDKIFKTKESIEQDMEDEPHQEIDTSKETDQKIIDGRKNWFNLKNYSERVLIPGNFYDYCYFMFSELDPELSHLYNHEYSKTLLSLISFRNDSQVIQLIEHMDLDELIAPQRAFANLNCLSLYAINALILRAIMNKQAEPSKIVFYQQNKLKMDMDQIMLWQLQYTL